MNKAVFTVDLGFGDSGKGTMVDFLTRYYGSRLTVRYNGGCQASHRVVLPGGKQHCFHQFGSGTFAGAHTFLSKYMLVNPLYLNDEAERLTLHHGITDPLSMVHIDGRALMLTPYHMAANKLREIARHADMARHGSCGFGIGEAASYAIQFPSEAPRIADMDDPKRLKGLLDRLCNRKLEEVLQLKLPDSMEVMEELGILRAKKTLDNILEWYTLLSRKLDIVNRADRYLLGPLKNDTVIFEGAQGVLLDEWYGFHPYTTWSTTTLQNAYLLTAESGLPDLELEKWGIIRSYSTRHGAGPFVAESPEMVRHFTDPSNEWNEWQRDWRVGPLDLPVLRYALRVPGMGQLTSLAVTHMDRVDSKKTVDVCFAYRDEHDNFVYMPEVSEYPDLAWQERITKQLMKCRPALKHVPADNFCLDLKRELGVPVRLMSYGPTHEDKLWTSAH